jgi:hypothetical protein
VANKGFKAGESPTKGTEDVGRDEAFERTGINGNVDE